MTAREDVIRRAIGIFIIIIALIVVLYCSELFCKTNNIDDKQSEVDTKYFGKKDIQNDL